MSFEILVGALSPNQSTVQVKGHEVAIRGMTALERDQFAQAMVALQDEDVLAMLEAEGDEALEMDDVTPEAMQRAAQLNSSVNAARFDALFPCIISINNSPVQLDDGQKDSLKGAIGAAELAILWDAVSDLSGMNADAVESAEKN